MIRGDICRFKITSPFSGTIINKHITLGEKVNDEIPVFTVADISTVWVYLTVYQKDLESVRVGQPVTIRGQQSQYSAKSKIDYVTPFVEESTRTSTARIILNKSVNICLNSLNRMPSFLKHMFLIFCSTGSLKLISSK